MKVAGKKKYSKSVVIVESPAKAKTINKILGNDFEVKACMGHVRDLPQRALGIDVDKDFEPTYKTIPGKGKILQDIRSATKTAPAVYLAPDPDREGEAIAWHLIEALKIPEDIIHRVTFNEITREGVLNAFKNPTTISMDRVNAQQARRLLDRLVGYKLSPLLWRKIGKGLSAGRVQSVAVKLIVDRENEIKAFKPEEYWEIIATLTRQNEQQEFKAELTKIDDKEAEVKNGEVASSLVKELTKEKFVVDKVLQKEKKETPPSPFTTSLLQQQASIRLRFSTKKTMIISQQLYEGVELGDEGPVGLITYMRTDSPRVAEEAITALRKFIKEKYGPKYLVDVPRRYKAKSSAQEAHEAIRPTYVEKTPESIKNYLTDDQYKLYKLIWRRFVATQMKPAVYLATDVIIKAGRAVFNAKGKELKFEGYTVVAGVSSSKEEQLLPSLAEGEELNLKELTPSQHFTEPPPRYSEASLVKTLEKYGIGRPSTYAPIISNIQERGYVIQDNRRLKPTELGNLVTEKLVAFFNDIMDLDFTARMEEKLDMVEEAKTNWIDVLREFYGVFSSDLDKARGEMETEKNKTLEGEENQNCELCGKPMVVRWNKFGKFLGCSGFPDCKSTKSLATPETVNEKCQKCGSQMVIRRNKRGQRFLACSGYPNCKNTRSMQVGGKRYNIPDEFDIPCEKCGSKMVVKYSRRGGFLACPRYPDCKSTRSFPREWLVESTPEESTSEVAE